MTRSKHPKKEVEEAIRYAESKGWVVREGGHWGFLYCPFNTVECRCGIRCKAGIWSTPKNPGNHARQLTEVVDGCTAFQAEQAATKADEDKAG